VLKNKVACALTLVIEEPLEKAFLGEFFGTKNVGHTWVVENREFSLKITFQGF